LLYTRDALALKLQETSIDTSSVWSVKQFTRYKVVRTRHHYLLFFKLVHGVTQTRYFLQGFCCANSIIKVINIFQR